nr:hypothetical protein CFP56_76243 [Quercus suber]
MSDAMLPKGKFAAGIPVPCPRTLEDRETSLRAEESKTDRESFLRFIRKMLQWEPEQRSCARDLRSRDGAMVLACLINVDMEDALYPCPFPVAEMGLACAKANHEGSDRLQSRVVRSTFSSRCGSVTAGPQGQKSLRRPAKRMAHGKLDGNGRAYAQSDIGCGVSQM